MDKRVLRSDVATNKFGIVTASRILNIRYLEDMFAYEVEYYESPFEGELDVYELQFLYDKYSSNINFDDFKGYEFHGKYWDKYKDDYFIILCKKVSIIKTYNKELIEGEFV